LSRDEKPDPVFNAKAVDLCALKSFVRYRVDLKGYRKMQSDHVYFGGVSKVYPKNVLYEVKY
jgi:hypothetical protein